MSDLRDLREREGYDDAQQSKNNKNDNNNINKYPKHLKILGIIGSLLFIAGVVVLILGLTKKVPDMSDDAWFDSNSSKTFTCFGGGVMMMIGLALIFSALAPVFAKWGIKTTRYVAKENKSELKDLADTAGDIVGDAAKSISRQNADAWNESAAAHGNASYGAPAQNTDAYAQNASEGNAQAGKFCENCGQPISASAKFCKHCGAKRVR